MWVWTIFFVFLQLFTLWYFLGRPDAKSIVIGVADTERKTMFWTAKPEKTWWDEFKEGLPYLTWGFLIGGAGMFLVMV